MNIEFTTIDYTGTPDDEDKNAATLLVTRYNEQQAALDPPGDELPMGTPAELKASYLTVLLDVVTGAHKSYAAQAIEQKLVDDLRSKWAAATDAQREAAIAALG